MKCNVCFKKLQNPCQSKQSADQDAKRLLIQELKTKIRQQCQKYNQTLQKTFGSSKENKKQQTELIQDNSTKKKLIEELNSIIKKENSLVQKNKIKQQKQKLKKKIMERKTLLQNYKKYRNQKLKRIADFQKDIYKFSTIILGQSQQKIKQMRKMIGQKQKKLISFNKYVKSYFEEVVEEDFKVWWKIYENFIQFEKRMLFQIKKVEELDFLNNNTAAEYMLKSFFELENVEQIKIKKKTSEKGVHIVTQYILILKLLQKIFKFWLPYPSDCQINLNESKLVSKIQNIKICNEKLIGCGTSTKLSNNIMQFHSDEVKSQSTQIELNFQEKSEEKVFSNLFEDQSSEYSKRKYELNKKFINYLQANTEYLGIKYGINARPLVFFDVNLVSIITEQYLWQHSFAQKENTRNCPYNINYKGYNSMIRQIKLSKLMESLLQTGSNKKNQVNTFQGTIAEEVQSEGQQQKVTKQIPTPAYYSIFNYFSMENSVFEVIIPESFQRTISNSTDNDQFQELTLESQNSNQ